MTRRLAALLSLPMLLGGCGSETTAPAPPYDDDQLYRIRIDAPDVVTLSPGESVALEIQGFNLAGRQLETDIHCTWQVERPAKVYVDDEGVLHAKEELGHTWLSVHVGSLTDRVGVWIQKPESEPSTFEITLSWDEGVPDWWRAAIEEAAHRWEQVVRAPLPEVDVATLFNYCEDDDLPPSALEGLERGLRIHVGVSDGFPFGTYVSAVGGPCIHRGLPQPTSVLGQIILNSDYFEYGIEEHRLRYVAHHEMGHTFGLVGVVQGHQPSWLDAERGLYRGHLALFGHLMDTGHRAQELSFANGAHWPFAALMGSPPSDVILNVTVGSLMDFGYPAAWYGAGPIGP